MSAVTTVATKQNSKTPARISYPSVLELALLTALEGTLATDGMSALTCAFTTNENPLRLLAVC